MWRGMLGEFDISTLSSKSAVVMYLVFQGVVVVLMMNLIIAIMGGTPIAKKVMHIARRTLATDGC